MRSGDLKRQTSVSEPAVSVLGSFLALISYTLFSASLLLWYSCKSLLNRAVCVDAASNTADWLSCTQC